MARKRGIKRTKTSVESFKHSSKKSSANDAIDHKVHNSSSTSSGPSGVIPSGEEDVSRELPVYDNLLTTLGSSSKKLAGLYKRRRREEEGRNDTEDDGESSSESGSISEEEDGDEAREHSQADIMEQSEEDDTEVDDETSNGLSAQDVENNGIASETASSSSFHLHLGRNLTTEEVDNLVNNKWKFKWDMPAPCMPTSKWMGTGEHSFKEDSRDLFYGLKQKLYNHWLNIYKTSGTSDFHSSRQRYFFSLCNSYRDIMHCSKKPFYLKGLEDSHIMDAYIMHALNHVYRTRDVITKNDTKLAKHQGSGREDILSGGNFLDHGFTRPKVLFLLPLGSIAFRVVKRLIQLTPLSNKANVEHIDRFNEEFGSGDAEEEDSENDGTSKSLKTAKPVDFQLLFGGNNNDHFTIGIKFTKGSIKLYSDFYSSDIIVASPLGLVTKIGEAEEEKEKDVDYLSSIEVLIIDHADVIAMQNWSHMNTVIEQMNQTPSKQHGTDVMRIRQWYLNGRAKFYRQTILLGSLSNPEMNAFFNRLCFNYEGKVKLVNEHKGVLAKVLPQVRQVETMALSVSKIIHAYMGAHTSRVYERFDAPSIVESDDARLDYFCKKVYPKIKDSNEGGTMILCSYYEFVRMRNFLKSQNASFCLLGEYTKPSDISRARTWFFEGKRKIMLYTERAHFYHRYKIRGVQNLIIYSLPERKEFYPEIINMLEGSKSMTCNVLFSRFDQLMLERIVGTSAAKRMVSSDKGIFIFC